MPNTDISIGNNNKTCNNSEKTEHHYNRRMKMWNPHADIIKFEFIANVEMLLKAIDYIENQ